MCSRLNCRFVHLMESDKVEVCDQRVAVCRDHANGQCKRKQCKYYHIPIVLPPANVMATIFKTQQQANSNTNNNNNNNNEILATQLVATIPNTVAAHITSSSSSAPSTAMPSSSLFSSIQSAAIIDTSNIAEGVVSTVSMTTPISSSNSTTIPSTSATFNIATSTITSTVSEPSTSNGKKYIGHYNDNSCTGQSNYLYANDSNLTTLDLSANHNTPNVIQATDINDSNFRLVQSNSNDSNNNIDSSDLVLKSFNIISKNNTKDSHDNSSNVITSKSGSNYDNTGENKAVKMSSIATTATVANSYY